MTAGYGLMLGVLAHVVGWPMARGGSQQIADALVRVLEGLGGTLECDHRVESLAELPPADAVLLDLTPRQVIALAGDSLPSRYAQDARQVSVRARGVQGGLGPRRPDPVDQRQRRPRRHRAPRWHARGDHRRGRRGPTWPPSRASLCPARAADLFDATRAPAGIHTAWAYCHVPNGSTVDMTARLEAQVERFAPGFRDRIIGRHTMNTAEMEAHDANYVGGDINGGVADLRQFVARPRSASTLGRRRCRASISVPVRHRRAVASTACVVGTPLTRCCVRCRSERRDVDERLPQGGVVMAPPSTRQVARCSGSLPDARLSREEERCRTYQPSGSA